MKNNWPLLQYMDIDKNHQTDLFFQLIEIQTKTIKVVKDGTIKIIFAKY